MEGVMKGVAKGTMEDVAVQDFVYSVFVNRPMAGGEAHRKLLWLQFLMQTQVEPDFPLQLQGVDVNVLASEVINLTDSSVLPGKLALKEVVKTIRAKKQTLEANHNRKKMTNFEKKQRHMEIRRQGDLQRAKERQTERDAKDREYDQTVDKETNDACEELKANCPFLSEQVLLAFRQAIPDCTVDNVTNKRRTPCLYKTEI
jgi:hypothetical protein